MAEEREDKPSLDEWLEEIKSGPNAAGIGMYLVHNGVVRGHSRTGAPVSVMKLSTDRDALAKAVEHTRRQEGIAAVRVWVNEGTLGVGDDIMRALVAGDIRDHVFPALQDLVAEIKTRVVTERERG